MMATDQEASDSEDDAKSELDRLDIPSDIEDGQEDETTDESSESDGSIEDEHDLDDLLGAQEDVDDEQSEEFHSSNNSMENTRMCIRQLVKRVRSCVNYIRNNRAINDYVCNRAGATQPPIRVGLAIDFEVRWNSTYIMLDRFVIYRAIVNEITTEPSKIPSVNLFQQRQLRSQLFQFSTTDWSQLLDLHSLMKPFFVATNTISARDYPTLALAYSSRSPRNPSDRENLLCTRYDDFIVLSFIVEFALRKYLTTETIGDSNFIKDLKECLLDKFEHYFTLAMGKEQKDASLVSAFFLVESSTNGVAMSLSVDDCCWSGRK